MPVDPPTPLPPSGNIATAIKNITGIYDQAINAVSDIAGALADVTGATGLPGVVTLVENLINLGQPDEVQAKLDAILSAIKDNFHQLNKDQGASQILERNTKLRTDFFDQARVQLESLEPAIKAHPSSIEVVNFIGPCIKALDDLGGSPESPPDIVWNMNFDWQVYWTDEPLLESGGNNEQYGLQAPNPNSDGTTVFVYTYSLPLYMLTVAIFLAVAGSLDANFITNYGNKVLRPAVAVLRSKYDKVIQEGLTQLSPPPPPPSNDSFPTRVGIVVFAGGPILIRYGAVEKYSGYSSVGTYQMDLPPTFPFGYTNTFNKLQLRLLKRTKDVYIGLGLPSVLGLINKLNALVGDAPLAFSNLEDWSFRECLRVTKLVRTGNGFSLRALADFVIHTPPFDTPYPVDFPKALTISLKELLTNFNENLASPPILGVSEESMG